MNGSARGEGFFPVVYDELRRLAAGQLGAERVGHTLDATALVHEAFVRLGGASFADRTEFLRAASRAMQRILVDHARARNAGKRGGSARRCWTLDDAARFTTADRDVLIDVAEALDRLAAADPGAADLARLHLFGGLSIEEAANALGLARASAFREWIYARAWLAEALTDRTQAANEAGRPWRDGPPTPGEGRTRCHLNPARSCSPTHQRAASTV